jgi:hypothetical protein
MSLLEKRGLLYISPKDANGKKAEVKGKKLRKAEKRKKFFNPYFG